MNVKHFVITASLGLGLSLALLWVLGDVAIPITAAPAPRTLSDATSIHYVAITGTDSGDCSAPAGACRTVQYAVDQAGTGDEIHVAAGTYTGVLTRAAPPEYPNPPTSDIITQAVYVSKTVTIRGGYSGDFAAWDPDVYTTTLDAQSKGRVMAIVGEISPTIAGLYIVGGDAVASGDGQGGGGVYIITASVTMQDNHLFDNRSSGLILVRGALAFSNNTVVSNTAYAGGGVVLAWPKDVSIVGNTFSSNTADWAGGGLYQHSGSVMLKGNRFIANEASDGGGLFFYNNQAAISGNTLISNTAGRGGALFLWISPANLNGNTIMSNTADSGGGVVLWGSDAELTNNVIARNWAHTAGSGIYVYYSSPRLLHNTIAGSTRGDGTGVYVDTYYNSYYGTYSSSAVWLTNTILVSHSVGISVTSGNTVTLDGILWHGTPITVAKATTTTVTVLNQYQDDPAFTDPVAGDYHIGLASAALDRGIDAGVTVDIDGQLRPYGPGYDLGADEYLPFAALVVTKQVDPDPVQAGQRLTYTLRVTNTGNLDLHATITDVLPLHITPGETPSGTLILPGGLLTWTALIPAPGGVWAETLVVTAETGYAGPLTNVVRVATAEGATGVYTATSGVVLAPTNRSPDTPSNPDPADGTTGVPLTGTLHWQGGDPDDDPVTYTVSFGVSDPPLPVSQVQTTSYAPGGLVAGTTYYWAVTASDGISSTAGPTWHFTTQHFVYLPVVLNNGAVTL